MSEPVSETLFDPGPGITPPDPPEPLSPTQRLTIRNNATLAGGRHPATRRKLLSPEWGFTCGGCAHHVVVHVNRIYHKCELHRLGDSASAASDIRIGWPACELFRVDS